MSVLTTSTTKTDLAYQRCINPACRATYGVGESHFACPACGEHVEARDMRAEPREAQRQAS